MKKFLRILIALIVLCVATAEVVPYFLKGEWGHVLYDIWAKSQKINVNIDKPTVFYVPTGSDLNDVANMLEGEGILDDKPTFLVVADQMNYHDDKVVPGKYTIQPGVTNQELITHLRGGYGVETVKVTFNNVRTLQDLAGKATVNIEADSLEMIEWLTNADSIGRYGFTQETVITLFIPNTYEFYWNTSVSDLVMRMAKEYKDFWNDERKQKASDMGLTQSEVATLASIVQEETNKADERPVVAGVYYNRLVSPSFPFLQADPTVKYAIGDWSIQRVWDVHLKVDSPYNTYMYPGLPPGPISLPEINALESVLNYEEHDYYYFCAKADFSGYHAFAETYNEHLRNARAFHDAMDAAGY